MLQDLIDKALLQDFVAGVARATTLRVSVYEQDGRLLTSGGGAQPHPFPHLPRPLEFSQLPADEPPARLAFLSSLAAGQTVAPIYVRDEITGYVALGDFPPGDAGDGPAHEQDELSDETESAILLKPVRPATAASDPRVIATVRWASRMLSQWCRREARLDGAVGHIALIGDIGELISGERDLQTVLDRIVRETAHAMNCRYASLRLYNPENDELRIAAAHNLPQAYLNKDVVLRAQNPIDDEAMRGNLVYIENAQTDPRIRFPEQARRLGILSGLTVGIMHHGKPVGVLRVYSDYKRRFRTAHRHLLRSVAAQAAIAIVNARLLEERLKAAELQRQVALAGELQARMMDADPPQHAQLEAFKIFAPSSHVSGDFCDFLTLGDGRFAAVVADVVGHGVPASLLTASVRGALRASAEGAGDLGELLTRLNRQVCRETNVGEFVTLLIVALDPARGRLSFCNAGHEPLLLLREGVVERPERAGLVLGVDPAERYTEQHHPLTPGDFLLLFTDGTIEAMNFDGEHYGRRRLADALRAHAADPIEAAVRAILWDVRRFSGLTEQSDDMTIVGVRVLPAD